MQKGKARERDKARKQEVKAKALEASDHDHSNIEDRASSPYLPWGLLTLSWIGFIAYLFISQ
ncbi:hypothetical protein TUM4433_23940 [Shewanella schlegeliana]|nr:hypothetical protein TUM4433_23940 [Shewanella schlegeliana]